MRIIAAVIVWVNMALICPGWSATPNNCESYRLGAYENEARAYNKIVDWVTFFRFYKLYSECSMEGELSEAVSGSATHLFASNWSLLAQFDAIARQNSGFRHHVYYHVSNLRNEISPARPEYEQRLEAGRAALRGNQ